MGRTVNGNVGSEEDMLDMQRVVALFTNPSIFVLHYCTVVILYWTAVVLLNFRNVQYSSTIRYYDTASYCPESIILGH
jgi:hypothetical protein